jgi:hypothetical protein
MTSIEINGQELTTGQELSFNKLGVIASAKQCIVEAHGYSEFEQFQAECMSGKNGSVATYCGHVIEFAFTGEIGQYKTVCITRISEL